MEPESIQQVTEQAWEGLREYDSLKDLILLLARQGPITADDVHAHLAFARRSLANDPRIIGGAFGDLAAKRLIVPLGWAASKRTRVNHGRPIRVWGLVPEPKEK